MLRNGIIDLNTLRQQSRGDIRAAVDVKLFGEIECVVSDDAEAGRLQATVLRRLRFANGTYKRTQSNRFDAFDRRVVAAVTETFLDGELSVLDIGVSDGGTAVDLYRCFREFGGRDIRLLGIDRYMDVEVRRHHRYPMQFAFDSRGDLVQVRHGRFVINCHAIESYLRFPVNHAVGRFFVPRWRRRFADGTGSDFDCTHIRLIGRVASKEAASESTFHLEEGDLFHPPTGPFHLVRAMNVLNPGYFSVMALKEAVKALWSSMHADGLLAVGANQDAGSPVDGAIYRRTDTGFERVEQADRPCRIDGIILDQTCKVESH